MTFGKEKEGIEKREYGQKGNIRRNKEWNESIVLF
jgi:hypothetical protein